jgi:hypothetical protein
MPAAKSNKRVEVRGKSGQGPAFPAAMRERGKNSCPTRPWSDVVLRFDRPDVKTKFAFRPLYPKLLSGDSGEPLD